MCTFSRSMDIKESTRAICFCSGWEIVETNGRAQFSKRIKWKDKEIGDCIREVWGVKNQRIYLYTMRSICTLHEEEQYVHWIMNKEKSTQQMALHEANICTNKNIVCWVYVIEYTPQPNWKMCAGTGYCWYTDCRRLLVVLLFRTRARFHSFILLYREKNTLLLNNSFLHTQNTNSALANFSTQTVHFTTLHKIRSYTCSLCIAHPPLNFIDINFIYPIELSTVCLVRRSHRIFTFNMAMVAVVLVSRFFFVRCADFAV